MWCGSARHGAWFTVTSGGGSEVARGRETIRIPRLRTVVLALASLVMIDLLVFLQRDHGADRTALALSLLLGGGLCLVAALLWFHRRFSGKVLSRRELWGIGLRAGAVAGVFAGGIGVILLAVRWAIDQQADPFVPAFLRALMTLGLETTAGLPAYLAVGAVVGGLAGLAVAEAIGISAERLPAGAEDSRADPEAMPLADRDMNKPPRVLSATAPGR
jgi:hypothetical protein